MKLVIGEREYPVVGAGSASLLLLMQLRTESAGVVPGGITAGMLIDELPQREDTDAKLLVMAATVWLTRRAAGDVVSFEEAVSVPLEQLQFVAEPGDPEADARPPARVPADHKPPAGKRAASRSTTSRRASASG